MSMTKPTAEQVTYKSKGIGAVTRTVESKLADVVSVKDFGAVGDGVADDTAAIQAAIDYVIYNVGSGVPVNHPGAVFMPGGTYRTTDTIHLGYGETFHSVRLYGDGRKYRAENLFRGTAIVPDFNDRPVIAVQGGRNTTIENLSIYGKNWNWIWNNKFGQPDQAPLLDPLVTANWVDPSFPASASSRYAPYCAIAVDPYSGPKPAVSYPNVNYPNWLNITTQYGKNFSDHTTISQVEIEGFVVGVAVQPCDADGNGDYTRLLDCRVSNTLYGISVGNTQARDFAVSDVQFLYSYCAIATAINGKRNGKPSFDVRNCSFNFSIYAAIIPNLPFGGACKFSACYAESLYAIGIFNASSSTFNRQNPLGFYDCEFRFELHKQMGRPRSILTVANTQLMLCNVGIFMQDLGGVEPVFCVMEIDATQTSLINCIFDGGGNGVNKKYLQNASNAALGFWTSTGPSGWSQWSARTIFQYNINTGLAATGIAGYIGNQSRVTRRGVRAYGLPIAVTTFDTGNFDNPITKSFVANVLNKNQCASVSQSGNVVTIDLTGAMTALNLFQIGGDVGDVVWDNTSGTVFVVSARTGLVVDMVAQNNLDKNGNLVPTITIASGLLFLSNCRVYTLQFSHWGDTSSSSANITNVKRGDGATINLNDATNGTQIGDALWVGNSFGRPLVTATAAPITNIVSDTITLTGNCRLTQTHRRLDLFVRAPTANNT
jgi:hypothetical protein